MKPLNYQIFAAVPRETGDLKLALPKTITVDLNPPKNLCFFSTKAISPHSFRHRSSTPDSAPTKQTKSSSAG